MKRSLCHSIYFLSSCRVVCTNDFIQLPFIYKVLHPFKEFFLNFSCVFQFPFQSILRYFVRCLFEIQLCTLYQWPSLLQYPSNSIIKAEQIWNACCPETIKLSWSEIPQVLKVIPALQKVCEACGCGGPSNFHCNCKNS